MWGRAKILCLGSVKGHWLLNPPLQRKQNSVYQVPFLCVRSIFINVLFIPISVSCHSSRLAPRSIQCDWHLDPSCVPVSRNNICATLLHIFQGTQAFHFRILALLLSHASKLQEEQQVSVSVLKHEMCIHLSYQSLNSNVFCTAQKGCISIAVLRDTLRLQSDLLSFPCNRDPQPCSVRKLLASVRLWLGMSHLSPEAASCRW